MRPNPNWPDRVFQAAHREYPQAVARMSLYCVAFFGHARPTGLAHSETCESVWRGLCRKHLRKVTG